MKTSLIIPAAGIGKRFGTDIPKQYLELRGVPIIFHTLSVFNAISEIDSVVLAVDSRWHDYILQGLEKYIINKKVHFVKGGAERQDSVFNALMSDCLSAAETVLVHDAVRPFASHSLVRKIIAAAEEYGAAVPAVMPKDTVKETGENNFISRTLDRNRLAMVQTPQGFNLSLLQKAYIHAKDKKFMATDDASLVEFIGSKVYKIEGEDTNIKITSPLDMALAELILDL